MRDSENLLLYHLKKVLGEVIAGGQVKLSVVYIDHSRTRKVEERNKLLQHDREEDVSRASRMLAETWLPNSCFGTLCRFMNTP